MITLYNHDSEKWLIGALIQDSDLQKQLPAVPASIMHDSAHEIILTALKQMQAQKLPIELLSVGNTLNASGKLEQAGGTSYLLECTRFCPSTANAGHYLGELRRLMESREAYRMANRFCHLLTDGEDLAAAVDELRTQLRNMITPTGRITKLSGIAQSVYDDVERRSRGENQSLLTKIPDLDGLIGGLEPGDMMVIGARPAVGKSAFGMQIALNVAQQGKSVMVCSREMSELQYGHRLVSNLGKINGEKLKRGKLKPEDWETLASACGDMSALPISFAFSSPTVEELRVLAQHEKDVGTLDLLVVDYLQILGTSMKTAKRYESVGAVSRALKEIALDLKIPVVTMAQVGRQTVSSGADRATLMPGLSDIRESGNIEQDADIVVFLHHPSGRSDKSIPVVDNRSLDNSTPTTRESIENLPGHQYIVVRVDKQRQGQCGSFGVDFDGAHMTYTCIAR